MDVPDQTSQVFENRLHKNHCFIMRIWIERADSGAPHYRGRLSTMTETNIGAFNSFEELLTIIERTLLNPVTPSIGKDQSDDA